MKNLLEKKNKGSTEEIKKLLKFMTLPLIAIILMIVIVILDKPEGGKEKALETVEVSSAKDVTDTTQEESETQETKASVITLEEEVAPEIHDLMEAYFKARRTCDVDAFSEVYGGTCGHDLLHAQRIKMEEEVKYYQSFNNLVCYTAPGLNEGEYVVYAVYDIKFRQADTLAPSMIAVYASTAEDGSTYLTAQPSEEQLAYVTKVSQSEQAQNLAAEVNQKLSEALKADENLLAVYRTLVVETDANKEEEEFENSSASESQENGADLSQDGEDRQEELSELEE